MAIVTIKVFKGRNYPRTITVTLNGAVMNFLSAGVNDISAEIEGVEYKATEGYLSFEDGGKVTFRLGSIPNPPRKSVSGRLIIYSDAFPLGKPILSEESSDEIEFEFV